MLVLEVIESDWFLSIHWCDGFSVLKQPAKADQAVV